MNSHALEVLEFGRLLKVVADRSSSELGAARVRALVPTDDHARMRAELERVWAMRAIVASDAGWSAAPIPDLTVALTRLRAAGSVWSAEELLAGGALLRSSRITRHALEDGRRPGPATETLAGFATRLLTAQALEFAVERAIDSDGLVRDDASPALRRLRRELRGAQGELVRLLERVMRSLGANQRVPDMSVTMRNGRYVIPVRREARGVVGGIVHDESATRNTVFVEPPAAVEFGNRIRELQADEAREVLRILAALTDEFRPYHEAMADALDALVELDALYARARFAIDFRCSPVTLCSPLEGFAIRDGRHPLLLAQGVDVVPFDLEMHSHERTLLLSGPNTGGKTVLLKALGLISVMTQSGIPAPVGEGTRVGTFDDVFADVGDEQSIEASLSTFSAHVKNLGEILTMATAASLALIDELGSGTDPAEGAALGGAILEELTRRETLTVATTHLGVLKLLPTEVAGIVNASLQFDEGALAPTYRLIKGIPGRSYGLGIARRLQLPQEVLARAAERLPRGERDVAALLSDLEGRDAALAERERTVENRSRELSDRLDLLSVRERTLRDAERSLERESRQEARRYLLEARASVERVIDDLREGAAVDVDLQREGSAMGEEATRNARRAIEALAGEQARFLDELRTATRNHSPPPDGPPHADARTLTVGDIVEVDTLGGHVGQLVELREKDAVLAVGGGAMKLTVPLSAVRPTMRRAPSPEPMPRAGEGVGGDPDERGSATELDLRGMRVEEMERALVYFLDEAARADVKTVRIIHGKGTGALRERVDELLRYDSRVREHRIGAWNEGGAGVTVAQLR